MEDAPLNATQRGEIRSGLISSLLSQDIMNTGTCEATSSIIAATVTTDTRAQMIAHGLIHAAASATTDAEKHEVAVANTIAHGLYLMNNTVSRHARSLYLADTNESLRKPYATIPNILSTNKYLQMPKHIRSWDICLEIWWCVSLNLGLVTCLICLCSNRNSFLESA